MAEVESALPVIDIDALLQPIPGDNPSGEMMQYSGLYDEIREARRADDASLTQGQWQTEMKVADYRQVVNLATSALTTQTKDLQIGVWLTEAITYQHGFAGLRDGLKLICGLEENFWDTLYPEIDEGDMEGRANAISWIDNQLSLGVKKLPLTLGEGFSYNSWEEAKRFDIPEDIDSLEYEEREKFKALRQKAEDEKRKTGEMWRVAKAATNRAFCEKLNLSIQECLAQLTALDRVNEEKFDRNQVPAVREIRKSLDSIMLVVDALLKEKREAEPDETEVSAAEEASEAVAGEDGEMVMVKKTAVASGAIQSRQDALKRLNDIAQYFKKNEPHSPVAYLLQRAIKWGDMPLEVWLQDVIKDDSIIFNVRQTLGFNTNLPES